VAALSDGRFVVAGSLFNGAYRVKMARLFGPLGQKLGAPTVLQNIPLAESFQSVSDLHISAMHRILSTSVNANDVYVAWTRQRPFVTYDLIGQALRPN